MRIHAVVFQKNFVCQSPSSKFVVCFLASAGSLVWPRLDAVPPAEFTVLASLLSPDEVQSILDVVEDESLEFDEDRDSVDDQATHEFYLERSGSVDGVRGITGKPDGDARVFASRLAARERLQEITRPIMQQRVVPFVNQAYASACKSNCFVCHSLIRRWRQDERVKHPTHFDIQALVTVVVSLTSYGKDFIGGLYVSTGERESYLALQAGDAVVHQSTLLHGVDVESGKRWSWIMWFKGLCIRFPALCSCI